MEAPKLKPEDTLPVPEKLKPPAGAAVVVAAEETLNPPKEEDDTVGALEAGARPAPKLVKAEGASGSDALVAKSPDVEDETKLLPSRDDGKVVADDFIVGTTLVAT